MLAREVPNGVRAQFIIRVGQGILGWRCIFLSWPRILSLMITLCHLTSEIIIATTLSTMAMIFADGSSVASYSSYANKGPDSSLPYYDRHFWRHMYYELFNKDFSLFGREMIQVCFPRKKHVTRLFLIIQMLMSCLYLTISGSRWLWCVGHYAILIRLDGKQSTVLSKIVTLCFEVANLEEFGDGGFQRFLRIHSTFAYHSVHQKLLPRKILHYPNYRPRHQRREG